MMMSFCVCCFAAERLQNFLTNIFTKFSGNSANIMLGARGAGEACPPSESIAILLTCFYAPCPPGAVGDVRFLGPCNIFSSWLLCRLDIPCCPIAVYHIRVDESEECSEHRCVISSSRRHHARWMLVIGSLNR